MLSDIERKLLRILYNFSHQQRRIPTMNEFEIKTGRRPEQIKQALLGLEKNNYITWEDKSSTQQILIIEAWERGVSKPKSQQSQSNLDYWTQY
ncbi:hypothetical protein [Paenibacillus medicaginis]|uniref:LexA repressor DNA-binding domain-containing protein n=1 Tax=Paenibacillus medicaginis TaxID=1470560 RepID=A0ABV5C0M7_9BACL